MPGPKHQRIFREIALAVCVVCILVVVANEAYKLNSQIFDQIEWHGEQFNLVRTFYNEDDYKAAASKLHPSETQRVRKMLLATPVPTHAGSAEELIVTTSAARISFPGYGESADGSLKDETGRTYRLEEFEIPETGTQRTLLYRENADQSYDLVLDEETPVPLGVNASTVLSSKIQGGKLVKLKDGVVYFSRELNLKQI